MRIETVKDPNHKATAKSVAFADLPTGALFYSVSVGAAVKIRPTVDANAVNVHGWDGFLLGAYADCIPLEGELRYNPTPIK